MRAFLYFLSQHALGYIEGIKVVRKESPHSQIVRRCVLFLITTTISIFSVDLANGLRAQEKTNGPVTNTSIKTKKKSDITLTRSETFNDVLQVLSYQSLQTGYVPIIIRLQVSFPSGSVSLDPVEQQARMNEIKQVQDNFISGLSGYKPETLKRFKYTPHLALTVDLLGLDALRANSNVLDVYEDIFLDTAASDNLELIKAPIAHAKGYTGEGQTIVILDSGIDRNHTEIKDKVSGTIVAEACLSTNDLDPDYEFGVSSLCPGNVQKSTAPGSGANCTITGGATGENCDHGTRVAGVAAGKNGVAPKANIIPIQIFSKIENEDICGSTEPCIKARLSDLKAGLEQVFTLWSEKKDNGEFNKHNIVAVNVSVAYGEYDATCNNANDIKAWIDTLRNKAGIATIVASGNKSNPNAIGFPSCVSSSISVGATTVGIDNAIWSESNRSKFMSLFAPGSVIYAPVPGGGSLPSSGTSFAAAHVSGAWALLKHQQPNATVTEILNRLSNNGMPIIVDSVNNYKVPRIDLETATSCLQNVGEDKWKGEYFEDVILDQEYTDEAGNKFRHSPVLSLNDSNSGQFLDKNFGDGTLGGPCGPKTNNFSVRWTRTINVPVTNLYQFSVNTDKEIRLYIDGIEKTQGWETINGLKKYPSQELTADNHIIKLEYKTISGASQVQLSWSVSPSAPYNLVASSISSSQIALNWGENDSNVSGFKIERSSDGGNGV